jgi:hypothetical protein
MNAEWMKYIHLDKKNVPVLSVSSRASNQKSGFLGVSSSGALLCLLLTSAFPGPWLGAADWGESL